MIYNQNDWDQDGQPILDQDLRPGYNELEEGIKLSPAEKLMIWSCISLALLAVISIIFYCVTYEPPT